MDLLAGLNDGQKETVTTVNGPVLVLAGAGSGKTKALTHRIAYLIAEQKVPPEKILAITFTNKAASEMANRVKTLISGLETVPKTMPDMGTFHSICAKILRQDGRFLGITPGYTIFDEEDSVKLIKLCLKKINIDDKKISPSGIKAQISNAKNEMMGAEEFKRVASGFRMELAAEVYEHYQTELAKNEALDFDDLLFCTVKLFQESPEALAKYQNRWEYLLIDEYQDTNQAQYLFAKLLAEKNRNICAVGDDWQSIYSWRGANFQNILNFERDWPEARVVKLEQNYRSTKAILTAAQNVIEKNEKRSDKLLWTENKAGSPIYVFEARSEEDEADFIVREAVNLRAKGGKLSDMAVFYRTNAQSRALEERLIRGRLPYKIIGGVRFYERKEIKDMLSWLRIASGASDFLALERSLSAPPSGVGPTSLKKIREYADIHKLKVSQILQNPVSIDFLGPKITQGLLNYAEKIQKIKRAAEVSLKEALTKTVQLSGYREYLSDGTFQNEERLENLNELLSVAEEYETLRPGIGLSDFLEEVALFSDLDNYQAESEGITLMTLHTAKGLEFKTVFIIGLEENIFPHSRSLFEPAELEEERRLFYVGITRAKETLYLLYAVSRLYFGTIQTNQPSRFLTEIPPALLSFVGSSYAQKKENIAEENIPGAFKIGEKIEHETFGIGEVKEIVDDELTVYFPEIGEKVISTYYAPVRKVK